VPICFSCVPNTRCVVVFQVGSVVRVEHAASWQRYAAARADVRNAMVSTRDAQPHRVRVPRSAPQEIRLRLRSHSTCSCFAASLLKSPMLCRMRVRACGQGRDPRPKLSGRSVARTESLLPPDLAEGLDKSLGEAYVRMQPAVYTCCLATVVSARFTSDVA